MTRNQVMSLLMVLATFAGCSGNGRSREDEKKALRLLGSAGGGAVSVTCKNVEPMSQVQTIFQGSLVDKDIADNLHETGRRISEAAKDCSGAEASFAVKRNPTIGEIKQILGKEDSTETSQAEINGATESIIVYNYAWLGFGVADGKVVAMVIDFKKSGL